MKNTKVTLVPLAPDDREQFIAKSYPHFDQKSLENAMFSRLFLYLLRRKMSAEKISTHHLFY